MKWIFWVCYLFLLGVLLPHTSWTFAQLESADVRGLGVAAAIAFELSIALLTHFQAERIAEVHDKGLSQWRELISIPSLLLAGVLIISVVANWTHASEFVTDSNAKMFKSVWVQYLYPFLFGAALPVCSFAFAYVLSEIYRRDKLKREATVAVVESEIPITREQILERMIILCVKAGKTLPPNELAQQLRLHPSQVDELYMDAKRRLIDIFKTEK